MSTQSQNILIKELPAHSVFIANSDPKGGATAVRVTQSGDYAAMQNYFDTVKPYDFSWRSAFGVYANDSNSASFVANWVMGSHQVQAYQANLQSQSMQSGNEAFGVLAWDANQNRYVMLDPTNTKTTSGSVSGNMPTLGNNQFGFFGMHTHPGSATPSGQDYAMTQKLGLDQMVIGTNGNTAIMTNNPSNNWQGQGFEFEDIKTDRNNGRTGGRITIGGYYADLGFISNRDSSTTATLTLTTPNNSLIISKNTGIEVGAFTASAGTFQILSPLIVLGTPFAAPGVLGASFIVGNTYRKYAQDTRVTFAVESSLASGTYGGPNPGNSYTDNGTNYGGEDGNTSPDGSAVNGF